MNTKTIFDIVEIDMKTLRNYKWLVNAKCVILVGLNRETKLVILCCYSKVFSENKANYILYPLII